MKLKCFHKYFSINTLIYLVTTELLLLCFVLSAFAFQNHIFLLDMMFLIGSLSIVLLCIIHYYFVPLFLSLIPFEFLLRKSGRIVKYNIVNIPIKFQKYIYIFVTLIYITITIVGIIIGQPMTEEELLYD